MDSLFNYADISENRRAKLQCITSLLSLNQLPCTSASFPYGTLGNIKEERWEYIICLLYESLVIQNVWRKSNDHTSS